MSSFRNLLLRTLSDGSVYVRNFIRYLRVGSWRPVDTAVYSPPQNPDDDLFAPVWDDASLARERDLLERVVAIAEARNIRLFLFWGTLLGHVREGHILAWDDDVDLALFDPGNQCEELRTAFAAAGLMTFDHAENGDKWLKVYDPSYFRPSSRPWTWPFLDIFLYAESGTLMEYVRRRDPMPRHLILPGRAVVFEGVRCWEPERPLDLLDRHFPGWRSAEKSSFWNHRTEIQNDHVGVRSIVTDKRGRKVGAVSVGDDAR